MQDLILRFFIRFCSQSTDFAEGQSSPAQSQVPDTAEGRSSPAWKKTARSGRMSLEPGEATIRFTGEAPMRLSGEAPMRLSGEAPMRLSGEAPMRLSGPTSGVENITYGLPESRHGGADKRNQ